MKIGDKVKVIKTKDPEDFMEDYMVRDTNVYVGEYGSIVELFLDQYVIKFNNGSTFIFWPDELQKVS